MLHFFNTTEIVVFYQSDPNIKKIYEYKMGWLVLFKDSTFHLIDRNEKYVAPPQEGDYKIVFSRENE